MLPIITIARQYGSGGHEIGEKLAERLNIPFYDRELIALAAKKSGYSMDVFEDADEKASNSLLYSMVMGDYVYGGRVSPMGAMPINDRLFMIQAEIITEAANKGSCVIIGRCADYVLREHKNLLRVFIYADKADRVKRTLEKGEADEKRVSDFITKKDKQRSHYYNFYSNNRWDDMMHYDLALNLSTFSIDEAVEILEKAYSGVHSNNK